MKAVMKVDQNRGNIRSIRSAEEDFNDTVVKEVNLNAEPRYYCFNIDGNGAISF